MTERWEEGVAPVCWCEAPAAGVVQGHGDVPAHDCLQCADHCALEADARRCRFALCTSDWTREVTDPRSGEVTKVCGLHVTAVLAWGIADPDLRPLRSGSVAA